MCRALAYLDQPVQLDHLLFQSDSALIRQSYLPKMPHRLNLAGFGMRAWDRHSFDAGKPFSYASTSLPVFDRNLKAPAEKIQPTCLLAHVRDVAYCTEVDSPLQNVHPFQYEGFKLALAHNGDLASMREMKPLLLQYLKQDVAMRICGTTDSEWIYALLASQLDDPMQHCSADELDGAVDRTLAVIREVRAQLAAMRYCLDFGCYRTEDPAKVHEANMNFLSLWYTSGREYGCYDGEWKMSGGADVADSIMIASEPLSRDTSAWLEVPEHSMINADTRNAHPSVEIHYLS